MNGPDLTKQRKDSTTWRDDFVAVDEPARIISAAPHGGDVEPETAEQAITVAETTPSCSVWGCRGYDEGGNAFDTWHEPSHLISPGDYAYLPEIKRLEFETAVTYHGYSPSLDVPHPDVYVGGGAPDRVLQQVADEIRGCADVEVWIAEQGDGLYREYSGTDPHNLTNWLADKGIQLEQTYSARQEHGTQIAEGVARALKVLH